MTTPYAVLLAGGAGTRFWPASRALLPKQLLPLAGDEPMLLATARRVLPLTGGWERVLVAGGAHLEAATRTSVPELLRGNLLLEPTPRNTAPCIGWAAATLARADPEALVMVLPSDHHVADVDAFRRTVEVALASAARGVLTTIGIRPHAPETGYGYIEVDGAPTAGAATRVARFVEKPDRARAEQFLASGRFLWNAGMFFFRAKDLLAAIRAHVPELAAALEDLDRAALKGEESSALPAAFARAPSVSLDVGVLEKLDEIAVVPGDFGWNDVGSWQTAWELAPKDAADNAASPSSVLVDARGNLVVDRRTTPGEKTIALVGVEGLAVVVTDDAVLVLPRDRAQDVRAAVDVLKKSSPKLV
ncbi:MAG TPA: mannose-1-phosphate guanylyltransferase [Byssovorax sp.]|jgi:mannose-1-phosphate guanylyltransferase